GQRLTILFCDAISRENACQGKIDDACRQFYRVADQFPKKSDGIVSRKIGEECILVPIRQGVGDLESIYTLNETAARIWDLLDGTAKGAEIKNKIVEEFDVTPEEAEKDLVHHLKELAGIKAITEE
ncbi:MAG: PqqD family protein, partial [Deltaproteobacteria bacterium]|nr:PqqD family protein [Deltaproteobacteria bacterium]